MQERSQSLGHGGQGRIEHPVAVEDSNDAVICQSQWQKDVETCMPEFSASKTDRAVPTANTDNITHKRGSGGGGRLPAIKGVDKTTIAPSSRRQGSLWRQKRHEARDDKQDGGSSYFGI